MDPRLNDPVLLLRLANIIGKMRGLPPDACKWDARTVLSSAILKMSVSRCAQRVLNWWCVESRMEPIDLCAAEKSTYERVMMVAMSGYMALEITWDEELNRVYRKAVAQCTVRGTEKATTI